MLKYAVKFCCSACLVVKSDLSKLNWLKGGRSGIPFMNFEFKGQ